MKQWLKPLMVGAVAAVGMAAVSAPANADGERFVLVSHAPDSDSW